MQKTLSIVGRLLCNLPTSSQSPPSLCLPTAVRSHCMTPVLSAHLVYFAVNSSLAHHSANREYRDYCEKLRELMGSIFSCVEDTRKHCNNVW